MTSGLLIDWVTVGGWQENSYLLVDESTSEAVLVDPGAEGERVLGMLDKSGAKLQAIWLTHAHIDHIGAIAHVKRKYDVPVYMHPADVPLFNGATFQAEVYNIPFDPPEHLPEMNIATGDKLKLGSLEFKTMHTPGHAPGHVIFYGNGIIMSGDLLFAGSVGRTDLPLCNPQHMSDSLTKIASLPESFKVYPGHGPSTTIEQEIRTNPFLNGAAYVKQSY